MGVLGGLSRILSRPKITFQIFWVLLHVAIFAYGWWLQAVDDRLAILNLKTLNLSCIRLVVPYIHTTAHYVNMYGVETTQVRPNTAIGIMYTQPGGLTGHLMLLIMVLMYTTAHHKIRAQCFETFWYTHHLAFFWALGLYLHATGCFVRGASPGKKVECIQYNSVYLTVWSGIAYFCDRLWRELRGRKPAEIIAVLVHSSGAIEIRLRKPGLKYVSGQWLFLQVPDISSFQWHPFTISSAPDDPFISIHVRQVGDFTRALGERLGVTQALTANLSGKGRAEFVDITGVGDPAGLPHVRIDGPYGAPAQDVFSCDVAILIGAGIGVTPFSSILKNIYYMQQQGKLGSLRRVRFIWLNKDVAAFGWFQALLRRLEEIQTDGTFLSMSMYLTGSVDVDLITNVSINDPIAPVDPLTGLKTRTHFGRPKWGQEVFEPVRRYVQSDAWYGAEASLKTKIGVFYCGPSPLAKTLRQECLNHTTKDVHFEFYKENC
ncbi:ferric reductase NAD binding domain-containing protein [Melampsora americana]|nr:ferric reductase NAD binding domain-containing protein [Melampsora americana]